MSSEGPSFFDILHSQAIIERALVDSRSTVNLSDFRLSVIPLNLTHIKFLLNLYLDRNALEVIPLEMAQLENLETLTLDYNKFSVFPTNLLLLTTLVKLNVSHNPIKEIPPQIMELQNLEVLWLNNIEMCNIPSEIGQLPKLEVLGARWNNIEILPKDILEMDSLRWLTLRGNKIKYLPEMKEYSNIVHLNLSQNMFEEFPNIANMKNLKYFYLGGNPLQKVYHENIIRLQHLSLLQLYNIKVPEQYLEEFPFLKITDPDVEINSPEQPENSESEEEDWADSLDTSDINTSEEEDEDDGFNNNWNNHEAFAWLPLIAKFGGCIE